MSLINDALKRAKQAQKTPPPPPSRDFKAVDKSAAPRDELPILLIIGLFIVVGMVVLVIAFIAIRRGHSHSVVASTPRPVPVSAPAAPAKPVSAPASAVTASTPQPAPAASASQAVASEQSAKPLLPKLQGIFFSLTHPSAVLDGKTVFVGGHVGDFQVIAITQEAVTVEKLGQTNVLVLPQ